MLIFGCINFFKILFHKFYALHTVRVGAEWACLLSGAARSGATHCPGRRGALPPVVRCGTERHHPLSGVARSCCHLLSMWKTSLNQTPYKSCSKLKCSNVVWVDAEWWTPVVWGDVECHHPFVWGGGECNHPLSRAAGSVTTRCPRRRGNLIGQWGVSHIFQNFL